MMTGVMMIQKYAGQLLIRETPCPLNMLLPLKIFWMCPPPPPCPLAITTQRLIKGLTGPEGVSVGGRNQDVYRFDTKVS